MPSAKLTYHKEFTIDLSNPDTRDLITEELKNAEVKGVASAEEVADAMREILRWDPEAFGRNFEELSIDDTQIDVEPLDEANHFEIPEASGADDE